VTEQHQTSTRIKICGITRLQDAEAVLAAGADAIGLNFSPRSPRCVDVETASRLADAVADKVCVVGVFLDQPAAEVRRALDGVRLDLLQFHGNEDEAFCASFGVPYMKAHRVREPITAAALAADFPSAAWHLLDAYVPGKPGGTGEQFDWQFWPQNGAGNPSLKLGLAGGLTPDNVARAIQHLHPDAVDVSGGVEGARKGEKDAGKMSAFVAAVRAADGGRDAPGSADFGQ
jgi:phosphoribosylanthranilate isomerase